MKLRSTLALFFLLLACLLSAQQHSFELGAEGGFQLGLVYGPGKSDLKKVNPLPAYIAGVSLRHSAPKWWGIASGIFVERKGFVWPIESADANGHAVTYPYTLHYNYVQIPLRLCFVAGKRWQVSVEAGGYVAGMWRIQIQLPELNYDVVNPGGYQYVDAGVSTAIALRFHATAHWVLWAAAGNNTGFLSVQQNIPADKKIFNTATHFSLGFGYCFVRKVNARSPKMKKG